MSQVWGSFWQDPEKVRDFRFDRRAFLRFWGFVRPYRYRLLVYVLLTTAESLAAVLPALLIRGIIDQALPKHDAGLLGWLVAGLAGVFLGTTVLTLATRWVGFQVGSGIILSLRKALYDHLQRMTLAFFSRAQTGMIQSRILNDVNGAENLFTETLSSALTDALGLIATLNRDGLFELADHLGGALVGAPLHGADRLPRAADADPDPVPDAALGRADGADDRAALRLGSAAGQALRPLPRRVGALRQSRR